MDLILDAVRALDRDAVCFQEVTNEMHAVIHQRLRVQKDWKVYRKKSHPEDYSLATAVRTPAANEDDKCISGALSGSNNDRHLLLVRRGALDDRQRACRFGRQQTPGCGSVISAGMHERTPFSPWPGSDLRARG